MVLLGFLAAVADLELVTGVLVSPQRQTALVAKQAAQVDVLSGGRLRLGLGVGWNEIEFRSLGRDFEDRGARLDEQIELLRLYWSEPTVRFAGTYDWADGVGIDPRPLRGEISIWLSASSRSRRAIERVGRLADGWLPLTVNPAKLEQEREQICAVASAAGRDPDAIGIQGRIDGFKDREPASVLDQLQAWRRFGATHVAINLMDCGLGGVDQHLAAMAEISAALGEEQAAG